MKIIELEETASTNTYLASYEPTPSDPITVATTEYQTAGRGQGANTWESERSKNLLFSIMVHPTALPAAHAFALSEAIALSIREAIQIPNAVTVKWPNDIYVGDCKIAGILIENVLQGQHIRRSIIGCGVDVNQEEWRFINHQSPTPISFRQILGHKVERRKVLNTILDNFTRRYADIQCGHFDVLHADYLAALYRRTGLHPYREPAPDAPVFMAEIADVEPSGHLVLRDSDDHLRRYAFKEVMYVASEVFT